MKQPCDTPRTETKQKEEKKEAIKETQEKGKEIQETPPKKLTIRACEAETWP